MTTDLRDLRHCIERAKRRATPRSRGFSRLRRFSSAVKDAINGAARTIDLRSPPFGCRRILRSIFPSVHREFEQELAQGSALKF